MNDGNLRWDQFCETSARASLCASLPDEARLGACCSWEEVSETFEGPVVKWRFLDEVFNPNAHRPI